jgi:uncharacterized protein YggE
MKTIRIAIAALLVLAAAALVGIGRPEVAGGASDATNTGITVTGTGSVSTIPDQADFSIGVTTKGRTAHEAMSRNAAEMQGLIAALKAAGVDTADLKTQDVSVGPDYDGGRDPSGYSAQNSLSVHIDELAKASAVLDAASRAGANQISGPTLSRSNRAAFEAKALKEAVGNARTRAEALAEAAGVSLGEVTAIVESGQPDGPYYAAELMRSAPKTPIEPGREQVTATVTVTFAIA